MKYKVVYQQGESDCAAASLATVIKHHGRNIKYTKIRDAVGVGKQGTTLLGLKRGAEALGFDTQAIKASKEILTQIDNIPLPAIIHWQGNHYVVLYGKRGNKYAIADPRLGIVEVTEKELTQNWHGWLTLLLTPDTIRFYNEEDDEDEANLVRFFKRIFRYRDIIGRILKINLVLGVLSVLTPFIMQILTDDVLIREDFSLLGRLLFTVAIGHLIASFLVFIQSNLVANLARRLELELVFEFGRHVFNLPLSYFESRRSGEMASRLRDIQEINFLISQIVISLPTKIFIGTISIILMLISSAKLTIITFIIAVVMIITTVIYQPHLEKATKKAIALSAENQAGVVESFRGILLAKTHNAVPQILEEFQSRFGKLSRLGFRANQIGIATKVVSGFIVSIGSLFILYYGGTLVIKQEITLGQLIAFNLISTSFLTILNNLIAFIYEYLRSKVVIERITEILDLEPENSKDIDKPIAEISSSDNIVCQNLSFEYPGRMQLLENFSLTIPGGKTVGIIGESGCGKSTLVKLLTGLYRFNSGSINIGAYNIADLPLDSLREQVLLVPQESHFWSTSIIENFRFCHPDICFSKIVKACQITGADAFINQLPNTYQTVLGEFGANISGGQRQKLGIARAIAHQPPVLILDESTSALDPSSEQEVLKNLLAERKGKTTILISHRPSVIKCCDWILYLDQGSLKAQGSPTEIGKNLDLTFLKAYTK